MTGKIRNTGLFLLAFILMIATGGFNVFDHYCSCQEKHFTSVIIGDFDCHHGEGDDKVGDPDENHARCCNSGSASDTCHLRKEPVRDHHCCSTTSRFYKTSYTYLKDQVQKVILPVFSACIEMQVKSPETEMPGSINRREEPPPIYGRHLVLFLQSSRTVPLFS